MGDFSARGGARLARGPVSSPHARPHHRLERADRHQPRAPAARRGPRCLRRRQAPEHVDGRLPVPAAGPLRALRSDGGRRRWNRVPARRRGRPPRRSRQGAPARPRARPGAREHDDDVQRARVLPPDADADHLQLEPRGLRRRPPVPDRGRDGRLRLRREHVLRLEDRRRGARLLVRALLPAARTSSSGSRTSTAATTTTCSG